MIGKLQLLNFSGSRQLPLIRQIEAAECGLACLAMVAGFYGYKTNLSSLRLKHPVSLKGATLKGLMATAKHMGLSSRSLSVDLESIAKLRIPCILHWNMNHFVVLKSVGRNRCLVHDPALGVKSYSISEVSFKFTGIALELSPTTEFKRRDHRRSMRLSDLWSRVVGLKGALAQTLVLSLIVQLFVLAAPFYMQLVVDEVLTKFDTDLLVVLALGFGLFVLINEAATALRAYVILYISNILGFQMVSNLFSHLVRLPLNWFEKRHVGDILSRFSSTQPIRDLFTEGLVAAVIDGFMAASTLILIFVYSHVLGLVILAALAVYLGLRLALYRPLRQRNEDQIVSVAQEQSTLIESVRAIQSIKVYGRETERESLWQNKYADVINSAVKVGKLKIGFNSANGLLFGIENTLVVYLGALMVVEGSLTIGMLFALMAYKRQFIEKATTLVERMIDYRLLGLHLERIADIGLSLPERGLFESNLVPTIESGDRSNDGIIEITDICHRYAEGESWVLKDVSMKINKGEMISIIGPSGSGKTTLMKVLLGLFEPNSGKILFEGIPLHSYGHAAYRRRVGTVMQDDLLLAGSLTDNITFFDIEPDFSRVKECAVKAAIHDDIAAMPMGYNSLVGNMGGTLSAGQRQRVLLARALYRDPDILILDEGTANLDIATEATIVRMLERLDITRICVTHRQPIITASSRVFLLESGTLYALNREQMLDAQRERRVLAE